MTKPYDQDAITFEAALDKNGCFKGNADKSGSLTFTVSASEAPALARLWALFTEEELEVTVRKKTHAPPRRAD